MAHNGQPMNPAKPDGVLTFVFSPHDKGSCTTWYDFDNRVEILDVQWLG